MHELSVAQQLVELVSETLADQAPLRVRSVRLRLGPLSGVVAEALLFAYDAATAGTALQGSTLEIEPVAAAVFCPECRAERELVGVRLLRCPLCHTPTPHVVRGRELEVLSVEVSEPDGEPDTARGPADASGARGAPRPGWSEAPKRV
jgi:hydrogenase nickel incorporation protein HypA/HybF